MKKHESEQIIKETIEYATKEIKKSKRRSLWFVGGVLLGVVVLLLTYGMLFHYAFPVAYQEGLVSVDIPEDEGIDIHVELRNYQKANAVLVRTGDDSYDLYIGIMQTAATKLLEDTDYSNNFLRVGNGLIADYQGGQLLGFVPKGDSEKEIQHIYYLDDLSEGVMVMTDQELMDYERKTLIWEREA